MKIGDYDVLGEIGIGSTSVVYRVRRGDATYAMKVMRSVEGHVDLELPMRFRREAALLARLHDPALPHIEEVGEVNGQAYVVMELASGESLDKHIERQRQLTEETTRAIGTAIAKALVEVHRLGLAHRDIKPENILFDGQGSVKLIDFGFAQEFDATMASNEAVGTFLYAPPEQTGMLKRSVDGRSDLYSLGAVMFECLTGRPVFEGASATELIQKHATSTAPGVSELRPEVRPALAAIVAKLLAKDPDDRYQTALGLRDDLENIDALSVSKETARFTLDAKGTEARHVHEVRLVGRVSEMAHLEAALAKARQGKGSVVQIEGEGGSGKSRLCQELLAKVAGPSSLVLRGKCQQAEAVPLGVVREALDAYALRVLRLPAAEAEAEATRIRVAAGAKGAIVRRLSRALETLLRDAPDVPLLEAANERDRSYWAIAEMMARLAEGRDVMVVLIDDVQWIDSSSLEVLRRFAGFVGDTKALLLTTARNDADSAERAQYFVSQIGDKAVHRLSLKPLDPREVSEYAAAFLGSNVDDIDARAVDRLAHVTRGNAFALGEYIRSMVDLGVLRPLGTQWVADQERLIELTVSQSVIGLIANRVTSLTPETADIASVAAVHGLEFDVGFLGALAGEAAAAKAIEEASRAALVERRAEQTYAFVHDRIREALVERLTPEQRKDIHQRLAELFEQRDDSSNAMLFALARHYVGGHAERNGEKIYATCLRAGRVALDAYANEQAYALLTQSFEARQALEALGQAGSLPHSIELDENLGQVAVRLSRLKEAHEHFARCLERATSNEEIARIWFFLSMAHMTGGDAKQALQSLETSLQLYRRPIPRTRAAVSVWLLWLRFVVWLLSTTKLFQGAGRRTRTRRQMFSKMLSPASQITYFADRSDLNSFFILREFVNAHLLGEPLEIARASVYYAFYLSKGRHVALIHRFGKQGLALSEQTGDWGVHAFCRHQYSISAAMGGDDVEAEKLFRDAIPYLKKYLGFRDASVTVANLATALEYRGFAREAVDLIYREDEVFTRTSNALQKAMAYGIGYSQCTLLGRAPEAIELKKKLLSLPPAVLSLPLCQSSVLSQEVLVALDQPSLGAEVDQLLNALYANPSKSYFAWVGYAAAGYVRLRQLAGAPAEQRASALDALQMAAHKLASFVKTPAFLCHVHVFEAAIASENGRSRASLALLGRAQKLAEKSNSKWGMYEVAYQRARTFHRAGDAAVANVYAEMALDIAGQSGWKNRAARVRSELGVERVAPGQGALDRASTVGTASLRAEMREEALLRVATASASSIEPVAQASKALDALIKVLNAERAFLFLADPDVAGNLVMRAGRDAAGSDLAALTGYSTTIVKKVGEQRTPLVVSGTDEGEVLGSQSAVAHNLRSIIAAPLSFRDEFRGVVYLDSSVAKGLFSASDLSILAAVASHIAIALEAAETARHEVERRELEKDMALISAVQAFFLPEAASVEVGRLRMRGYYRPATQASGDWWWHETKDDALTIMVGDVTGHGAAPAMITAANAAHMRMLQKLAPNTPPEAQLAELDAAFRETARGKYMMTLAMLRFSASTGVMQYWNAGAPAILIVKADGTNRRVLVPGSPLGSNRADFGYQEITLGAGDRVLLATDGISEMAVPNGKMLRSRKLDEMLKQTLATPLPDAVDAFVERLDAERKGTPLADDMTMVMIDVGAIA